MYKDPTSQWKRLPTTKPITRQQYINGYTNIYAYIIYIYCRTTTYASWLWLIMIWSRGSALTKFLYRRHPHNCHTCDTILSHMLHYNLITEMIIFVSIMKNIRKNAWMDFLFIFFTKTVILTKKYDDCTYAGQVCWYDVKCTLLLQSKNKGHYGLISAVKVLDKVYFIVLLPRHTTNKCGRMFCADIRSICL